MKKMAAVLAGAALLMATSSAMATTINMNSGEPNLQNILDNITVGGPSSIDAATGFIPDPNDAIWTTGGVGVTSATMVIELAGNAGINSFGIYDASDTAKTAELFAGSAAAGDSISIKFKSDGTFSVTDWVNPSKTYQFSSSRFGFYFNNGSQTFYSDTTKNADQFDHMVAYGSKGQDTVQLPGNPEATWLSNEYILAFEDTLYGGDSDYNDMVLMVESVAPVPEPGTMMLLGAGFLGLAIYGKRRRNA